MNAEELARQLEGLGARLVAEGGRLMINVPVGAVTAELRAEMCRHRAELPALLSGPVLVNLHVDLRDDPRPDLGDDSPRWAQLLREAAAIDYDDPHGLFGALYGIRIQGARLETTPAGWRIARPADMGSEAWAAERAQWLVPHRAPLQGLLAAQGASTERTHLTAKGFGKMSIPQNGAR